MQRFRPNKISLGSLTLIFIIIGVIPIHSYSTTISILSEDTTSDSIAIEPDLMADNFDKQSINNEKSIRLSQEVKQNISQTLRQFNTGFRPTNIGFVNDIRYFVSSQKLIIGFGSSWIQLVVLTPNHETVSDDDDNLFNDEIYESEVTYTATTINLTFLGSNVVSPIVTKPLEPEHNYFLGDNPNNWYSCKSYQQLIYKNIYTNIDLLYSLKNNILKYEFYVYPGGNPNEIKLHWTGPIDLAIINDQIKLTIHTPSNTISFIDTTPVYYRTQNKEEPLLGSFKLFDPYTYGFEVPPDYNSQKLLIIDPEIQIKYSTYIGGENEEVGHTIVVDQSGNIYVGGYTASANFPMISSYNGTFAGGIGTPQDGVVFKLSADGSKLLFSTYIGGNGAEQILDMEIDFENNIYLTGYTFSSNFPTTEDAFNRTYGGLLDVFITKLAANGSTLLFSTYIGQIGYESSGGLTLDSENNIYVTGYTSSPNFPTTNDALNKTYNDGWCDIFVTKLAANGSNLLYSTFIGGNGSEQDAQEAGIDICLDTSSNIYVTGGTEAADFPVVNAVDNTGDGDLSLTDVIVFKLSANGSSLIYSTYISGTDDEKGVSIVVDDYGHAYVTGYTESIDFPTNHSFQASGDGDTDLRDAFVFKLSVVGSSLNYSTYLSGDLDDEAYEIIVDDKGYTYVCGETWSTNFPHVNAYDDTGDQNTEKYDIFLTKLNYTGSDLIYSTYIGGNKSDAAHSLCRDSKNNIYLTGETRSYDFPITDDFYNDTKGDSIDIFVMKITTAPAITLVNLVNGTTQKGGTSFHLSVLYSNGTVWYNWDNSLNNISLPISGPVALTIPMSAGLHTLKVYAINDEHYWTKTLFTFTVDVIPPLITLNEIVNNSYHQSGAVIDLSVTGSNGTYVYNWDGTTNTTVSITIDPILPSSEGSHYLYVYASDDFDNWNSSVFTFITDDTPPSISLVDLLNNSVHQSNTQIDLTITGSNGSLTYRWDDSSTNKTVDSSQSPVLPKGDGTHYLYLYVSDEAGNWNSTHYVFITDDTAPEIILISPENGSTVDPNSVINITISESISQFMYHWDSDSNQTVTIGTQITVPTSSGRHLLYIYAVDSAGNEAKAVFEFVVPSDSNGDIGTLVLIVGVIGVASVGVIGTGLIIKKKAIKGTETDEIESNTTDSSNTESDTGTSSPTNNISSSQEDQ
ncbi:MAG: SBBP repeat-containing protein [Candidatus Hodarchaeota archaeon]